MSRTPAREYIIIEGYWEQIGSTAVACFAVEGFLYLVKNSRTIQGVSGTNQYYPVIFLDLFVHFIVDSLSDGRGLGEKECDDTVAFSASYSF